MTYKYMRDSLEDKYGFLKLQDKILEIAVYIDKFCYENDIKYCLMGGFLRWELKDMVDSFHGMMIWIFL